jgi:hypothetical protein
MRSYEDVQGFMFFGWHSRTTSSEVSGFLPRLLRPSARNMKNALASFVNLRLGDGKVVKSKT